MTRELLFIPQKLKTLAHFLLNCVACKVNPREGKLLTKPRPNKNSSAKSLHSNHYLAHIHVWNNPVSKRVCANQWVMSSVYLDMQSTVQTHIELPCFSRRQQASHSQWGKERPEDATQAQAPAVCWIELSGLRSASRCSEMPPWRGSLATDDKRSRPRTLRAAPKGNETSEAGLLSVLGEESRGLKR